MRRILAVILMVGFAGFCGCGEVPGSSGNQGGGDSGNGGSVAVVDSAAECFDFEGNDRADFDDDYFWVWWSIEGTENPWDPSCVVDGVGYESTRCVDMGEGVDQQEYHNVCKEHSDTTYDDIGNSEPCKWKVAAEVGEGACQYFLVCLKKEDYSAVPSRDVDFPNDWDEAVDKYCVD